MSQQAGIYPRTMSKITSYLSRDFLGGPRVIKFAWVINLQKCGTAFFVGGLMWYYQNTSIDAWVYLSLHGTYGFLWIMKHFIFPDKNWEEKVTFGGAFMAFAMVLGPYWIAPFLLISDVLGLRPAASFSILAVAISMHTFGVVLMMAGDAQKHYTLKYRKGLINEGFFRHIRHTNYLGEMMIYGSYALVVGHWLPWAILGWVWLGVFLVNIMNKEASLSRYEGWAEYRKSSWRLIPGVF